jgi:hypothetical protein
MPAAHGQTMTRPQAGQWSQDGGSIHAGDGGQRYSGGAGTAYRDGGHASAGDSSRTVDGNGRGRAFDPHRASTAELVSQAAGQISTLVRSELALGKAELIEKGRKLGMGGGMLAAAGVLGLYALGLLITLFVVVLDRDWPLWLAVLVPLLVVGVLMLGLAGLGVRRLRAAASPPPTADRVRDDLRSLRHAIREGRSQPGNHHNGSHHSGSHHSGTHDSGDRHRVSHDRGNEGRQGS